MTANRVLHRYLAAVVDAKSTPIVPDCLHMVEKNVGTAVHVRTRSIDAVCRMPEHKTSKHYIAAAVHTQSLGTHRRLHNSRIDVGYRRAWPDVHLRTGLTYVKRPCTHVGKRHDLRKRDSVHKNHLASQHN